MSWEHEWKRLAVRLDAWHAAVDSALRMLDVAPTLREKANRALAPEANEIFEAMKGLALPADVKAEFDQILNKLDSIERVVDGERVVNARTIVLAALRIPLDKATRDNEGPRRRLVDRAFLHLNRTLAVDGDSRTKWSRAFAAGETHCEKLGALHLLSHGIYAFKADGNSGRTDLILGDRLAVNEEVRAAEAMVLTEWKLARDGDSSDTKCLEGRTQAELYSTGELGGFELRRHRYIVVVSRHQLAMPSADTNGLVTYHYVNIAVEPLSPSQASRAAT